MDPIVFTYVEVLQKSSILPETASVYDICYEIKKHPDRHSSKLKSYITDSLSDYCNISRENCKKIDNISKKIVNAAIKSIREDIAFENKKFIFDIENVSSDESDASMMSLGSTRSTRSNATRERGRPRSITPQKRRGRPRSDSSSTSRTRSTNSLSTEENSYEIRSHGNSVAKELLEALENLKASQYQNKKKKYKSWWFILFIHAAERSVSPRCLISIMQLLKEMQPILFELDIPSESLLKQYKLAVPSLNEFQIKNFIQNHSRMTLCFDETPSRYNKCVAIGLFTPDGDFICVGIRQCSGNTGDTLLQDRLYKFHSL